MGKFHELAEFESRCEVMEVDELRRWHGYWTRQAQFLAPKVRKEAMKRVYDIEKAIAQKGGSLISYEPAELPAPTPAASTHKAKALAGCIMYIECKAGGLTGLARIGRVTFSQTGRTLYYRGQSFRSLKGRGFKANYYCVETGEDYWISGPKRRGGDALYGGNTPIEIDEDVREEYWREIRGHPDRHNETVTGS